MGKATLPLNPHIAFLQTNDLSVLPHARDDRRLNGSNLMKVKIAEVPPRAKLIAPSSWPTKGLAHFHLELVLFCEFGCRFCSSNNAPHMRFLDRARRALIREQIGRDFDPHDAADVLVAYQGLVAALRDEITTSGRKKGKGKTLVVSQLTDAFAPQLVRSGTTREVFELLVEHTDFRIRVLTKSSIVGRPEWLDFFARHADRFVVGLSCGSLDDAFAKKMERLTSPPSTRIRALHALQDAGVPTFGMWCPVFPQVLDTDELERLIDVTRPDRCEQIWAEPFNDRSNWRDVRDCYAEGSDGWNWMTDVFERRNKGVWSSYAAELYERVHRKAIAEGWSHKLAYLLYEKDVAERDAHRFGPLNGVLLQSPTTWGGFSSHSAFAAIQSSMVAS